MKKIGLALGGGGVRGLAHIGVLECLDRLGLKPAVIAGCSMGAVLGALYASGLSGRKIRELVFKGAAQEDDGWRDALKKRASLLSWVSALTPDLQRGGLFNTDRLLHRLLKPVAEADFADLGIPLIVVATDFWSAEEVAIAEGPLLPAVQASMAVPGVFAAVKREGKILVDGGLVNQLPYDLLSERADVVIAVDAGGERLPEKKDVPSSIEAILGASDIMQRALLNQKLKRGRPDVLVRPRIRNVELMDFAKADEVLKQSGDACGQLESQLRELDLAGGDP